MFSWIRPEHVSLMSTMLTVVGGLTACFRYLLKVAWRLKLEADRAKDQLATMRIQELKNAIDEHKGYLDAHSHRLDLFEAKINDFGKRLDANRDSADAAVSSLRAFVEATEGRFGKVEMKIKEVETNFGKVTVKP